MPAKTFSIYNKTILHPLSKQYMNVLCLSDFPFGSLNQRVKLIHPQRLSDYQNNASECVYVLTHSNGNFVEQNQLSEVFSIIVKSREYFIHNEFVPFLNKNSHETICLVSYIDTEES